MFGNRFDYRWLVAVALSIAALSSGAQSFRVQCPTYTTLHPLVNGQPNPNIKCQQISGGDGFATMGDGTQTYLFAFGPLSGLADMVNGLPGTQPASVFNTVAPTDPAIGDPTPATTFNGAIGLVPDPNAGGALTGHVDPRFTVEVKNRATMLTTNIVSGTSCRLLAGVLPTGLPRRQVAANGTPQIMIQTANPIRPLPSATKRWVLTKSMMPWPCTRSRIATRRSGPD